MDSRPARRTDLVIPRVVLLAVYALALSLIFSATNPTPTPPAPTPTAPELPATQPGLSHDEGVFLLTPAADGSQAVYFIGGNARHSISLSDMQLELQQNPLWPVRPATAEDVLAYVEAGPVGSARTGLMNAPQPAPAEIAPAPVAEPAPAVDDAPSAEPTTYVLQPGDNLTHIAARFGITVDAILAANGLSNANRIYAGQPLAIPGASDALVEVAPAPEVADVTADAPDATADAESADTATAASDGTYTASDGTYTASDGTYIVQRGDSAFVIARRFGIDQTALLQANNISNANRVYIGQVLTIPGA